MIRSIVVATLAMLSASAFAQYPEKPIKLIVPWGTGGSTDAIARSLAQRLSQTLGQSVIVDNKPGAAAAIGTDAMAKAAPDGYTLGIIELPHAIAPAIVANLPYDLQRDLQPVMLLGTSPLALFTSAMLPAKNIGEMIAAAKLKPGEIAIAHSGSGSASHLAAEMLQAKSNAKFNLASYKGSGPAMLDVAGGHVQAHFATYASAVGALKTGKVNLLAVASEKRLATLKDTPTFAEAGVGDFVVEQWWGVVVPKGTPAAVSEKLAKEIAAAMKHESMQERLRELAVEPRTLSSEAFAAFIDAEMKRWFAVVKASGIKPQ